jgi:hypothetical protein
VQNKLFQVGECQVLVVTHNNPSYSGGRDQEDGDLRPIPGKKFVSPYLENTQCKKWLAE